MKHGNVFAGVRPPAGQESALTLFENKAVKIQRIVSASHRSPTGFWYDQDEDEWVVVLKGSAALEFERDETLELGEGDYLAIPAHVRHRVRETSDETVWLAIHIDNKTHKEVRHGLFSQ